jgi:hypothetical protein
MPDKEDAYRKQAESKIERYGVEAVRQDLAKARFKLVGGSLAFRDVVWKVLGEHDQQIKTWAIGRELIVGIIGALVGGAITFGITWWSIDKTVNDTERAFVVFGKIVLQRDPSGDKTVYGISVEMVNAGKTPARRLRVETACPSALATENVPEPFSLLERSLKGAPETLGPNQKNYVLICIISESEFYRLKERKLKRFIVGEVRYEDIFSNGKPHITRMAKQVFVDESGYSSRVVGNNNCIDDDCP